MIDGIHTRGVRINLEFDERFAKYKGLHITPAQIGHNVRGSVHKFLNNGEHNANDYHLSDFEETLNRLFAEIGLNADIAVLNALEFGVNIKLPITPERALNRLILHKSNTGTSKKGYREFEYNEYIFKIYDKSGVEHIRDDIIRVEIRVEKMRYIRDKKRVYVKALSDLLSREIWEQLENVLIESVEECLFIDLSDSEVEALPDKLQNDYHRYNNPRHWEHLHTLGRMKYKRERERCEKFLIAHSTSTLKQFILSSIRDKCRQLRDIPEEHEFIRKWVEIGNQEPETTGRKCYKITNSQNAQSVKTGDKITNLQKENEPKKCDEITNSQNGSKNGKCDEITIKIKCDFVTPTPGEPAPAYHPGEPATIEAGNVKRCQTCGRIIENPKKGQKYCSAKVVGYEAAHKCRNTASNPRNNTRRSIERVISYPMLFDLSENIAPEKRKYMF